MSKVERKDYHECIGRDNNLGLLERFTVNEQGNTVTTFFDRSKEMVAYNINYRDFFIRN
jgi:hypothetical protein